MDAEIINKISSRKNFLIDHKIKYIDFKTTVPERLNVLQYIANSLPEGKRKASMNEIIGYFHEAFTEVLKDYEGLQEGSQLRNRLEDAIASLSFKEEENNLMMEIITNRKK